MVFVTDFDGTVTDDDFFQYTKEAYFDEASLAPWFEYTAGKITHFEALRRMYSTLRINEAELVRMINLIHVDKWVTAVFHILKSNGIPIYIASAGCDFYINILFGQVLKEFGVTLITNPSTYDETSGLTMSLPPNDYVYFDPAVGINKAKIVTSLQAAGKKVIFAGDGPPDIDAARVADVVFAKKTLIELCEAEGLEHFKLNSYHDIYQYLKKGKTNGTTY